MNVDVSRAVLEAVAAEAYRSGTITPLRVQQMLGLASRWQTESFLRRAEAHHDYTVDDLERIWRQSSQSPTRLPSATGSS
jgi:hypothetical protein